MAVVEEANFTRAAARLHVAQPGVSAQVRRLEREFGQTLLDRSGRKVRLTEVGTIVLPYARAALAAVEGARFAVDELTGLLRGQVRVGTVASISSTALDLPGMLADFHQEHPAVEITLSEDNSNRMVEAMQDGRIDVALIGLGNNVPQEIETRVVYDDPLVIAVSYSDPLAKHTTTALGAIRERDLISLPRGTGLRSIIDDACAAAGFQPRITFEVGDPEVLAQLVGQGLGVAILPGSLVGTQTTELHTITITRPQPRGRIALAWRAEGSISPAARALVDHACKMFEVSSTA